MEPQIQKSSEEIDLLYFFNPLIRAGKRLMASINSYFRLLHRKRFIFLTILIIAGVIGASLRFFITQSFKTNAIYVSYNMPANFCISMINNLEELVDKDENTALLAKQVNVPAEAAASILRIEATPLDSLSNNEFGDSTASAFQIDLLVADAAFIPVIQKGLENYLENNDFALRRKEARKKTLEATRNSLIDKRQSFDSLKEIVNASIMPRSNGQGIILGEPISPVEVYQVQQNYYTEQLSIEEQLSLLQNIDVVQPFFSTNIPNYPSFRGLFFYFLAAGFILALIITPFIGKP